MLLGIFCQPLLLNVLKVILNVHAVYLPIYPCPVVSGRQSCCLVICVTTAGGSYQGDLCGQSTVNQSLTQHVGIGRQDNSRFCLFTQSHFLLECCGPVQDAPLNNLLILVHARLKSYTRGDVVGYGLSRVREAINFN